MSGEEIGIDLQRKRGSRCQGRCCWRIGHKLMEKRGKQKEVLPADSLQLQVVADPHGLDSRCVGWIVDVCGRSGMRPSNVMVDLKCWR